MRDQGMLATHTATPDLWVKPLMERAAPPVTSLGGADKGEPAPSLPPSGPPPVPLSVLLPAKSGEAAASGKGNRPRVDTEPVRRQDDAWRLLAYRDQARADQRDALDRRDVDAATFAAHRRLRAERALDRLRAKRTENQ